MPIRRQIQPRHQGQLLTKLRGAFEEKDPDRMVAFVKEHLDEAGEAQFVDSRQKADHPIITPCIIFLIAGSFECPTIRANGAVEMTTIEGGGFGYEIKEEDKITLHQKTVVIVIQIG